jgi:hypothetical protein
VLKGCLLPICEIGWRNEGNYHSSLVLLDFLGKIFLSFLVDHITEDIVQIDIFKSEVLYDVLQMSWLILCQVLKDPS